ncbi:MAG: cupin domain-containing protein, partial [Verrucomicrobiota bacterium]
MLRPKNLLAALPEKLPSELTEVLFEASGSLRLERIVSTGQASAPGFWYDQEEAEWILVLSGEGCLEFEFPAEKLTLAAGDSLLIPAHRRHRVAWTSPEEPT